MGGKGWACHGESPTPSYSGRQWGAMDGYQAGRKGIRCGEAKGWGAIRGPGHSTGLPEEGVGHGGLSGEDRAGLRHILWLNFDLGWKEEWHEDEGGAPGGDPGTGQARGGTVSWMLAGLSLKCLWASDSKSRKWLEILALLRRSQSEWGCFCQLS